MATIKFFLQSSKNPANIYLRLSVDRATVLRRKTGYVIDPDKWSSTTNLPKPSDESLKKLKNELGYLANEVEQSLNVAASEGKPIDGGWLQEQIDLIQNKEQKNDLTELVNYTQVYIDNLPYKEFPNGKKGVAHGTIQKYQTLKNKISDFQKHKKKRYYLKDVDLRFRNDLLKYFTETDKLNSNSSGRYIRFLKTVCLDAKLNGYQVSSQLNQIKGFTEKAATVFLSFDELKKIEETALTREALINARDWLIIGCYIGQRVSDLLLLTSENICSRNGVELIELEQVKTGKKVAIPIHPKVRSILNKRNGKFPNKISAAKFNLHIKDVCREAKIENLVEGAKLVELKGDKKSMWRKEHGVFPKHELITSHVCRRSFASNFYGEIPTALLISITGHSAEQQFLTYIGKTTNDYAIQIAEYWNKVVETN